MHAQKWSLFYPKRGKKIPFLRYTRKCQKIRQRQFYTNCRFSQRWSWLLILPDFTTNFSFGPLNGETWWCKKWRKNHGANANRAIVPPHAGVIDSSHRNYWYLPHFSCVPQKGDFLPAFQAKKSVHFCVCMGKNKLSTYLRLKLNTCIQDMC